MLVELQETLSDKKTTSITTLQVCLRESGQMDAKSKWVQTIIFTNFCHVGLKSLPSFPRDNELDHNYIIALLQGGYL